MSYPLKSVPYTQHSFSSHTQPTFSTINNPCTGQKLTNNINTYLTSVINSKLRTEAKYWQSTNISYNENNFTSVIISAPYNYIYTTACELLSGHIKVSGLSVIGILIPPKASDLLAAMTSALGRNIRIGDTCSLTISNANTSASVFIMTNIPNGSFSEGNSTYNGWLDRFILVGTTSTYWIRVENIQAGQEHYSFLKTNTLYSNYSLLPNPPADFPDADSVTAAINAVQGEIPPLAGLYDMGTSDTVTGVPSP
tara:strand:+ start:3269 stop:4027 length:759 start_codon:yes stop_codon:yes gene_type:complete